MKDNINTVFSVYNEAFCVGLIKLIGLEVLTLLLFLGVYISINSKWRLHDNLHFLGSARTLIVLVPATILAVPFGIITIYKGLGAFIIYFTLLWVLTTEVAVRWSIAVLAAAVIGLITWFICTKISPTNVLVTVGIPSGIGFITLVATFSGVSKSSWLGERCPHCTTRGSVKTKQVGKDFLGTTSERSTDSGNNSIIYYNKYLITYQNSCGSCTQSWISTSETKERS